MSTETIIVSSALDKRLLFRVKHHPAQKQSPNSLVRKRINSLTLFRSSTGKLKCQRCCEQRREYMMSDKTPREGRGRTEILSSSPQSRLFKHGIWICLIIHSLCPVLQPAGGVKVQEGEARYHRHHHRKKTVTFSLPFWEVHDSEESYLL